MIIPVLGMDPSMRSWGLASIELNMITGIPTTPLLTLIEPKKLEGKQTRVNSSDLYRAHQLAEVVVPACQDAKIIFAEVPVGSQSADGMKAYGVCVGILGTIRSMGMEIIEVQAADSKKALTGDYNATKQDMIDAAMKLFPNAGWLYHQGKLVKKNEHLADAIAAILAGVKTPDFLSLKRLYEKV